jgi:hypothetical protein
MSCRTCQHKFELHGLFITDPESDEELPCSEQFCYCLAYIEDDPLWFLQNEFANMS